MEKINKTEICVFDMNNKKENPLARESKESNKRNYINIKY